MSEFSIHRKAYDQWEQVKRLDTNNDGKITRTEVSALDSDQSGKLNDNEFQQAGLSDPSLQAEMRLRYKQAADQALIGTDPDTALFQPDEIDDLSAPEWDKAYEAKDKGDAASSWISGGVVNALDPNGDQQLTIAEFRTLDPIQLQQMASQRGVDPRIVDDIGNYLDFLVIDNGSKSLQENKWKAVVS